MKRIVLFCYLITILCSQQLNASYRFLPILGKPTWQSTHLARALGSRATQFALIKNLRYFECAIFWIFTKTKSYAWQEEFRRVAEHIRLGQLHELENYEDHRLFSSFQELEKFIQLIAQKHQKRPSELQIVVQDSSHKHGSYSTTPLLEIITESYFTKQYNNAASAILPVETYLHTSNYRTIPPSICNCFNNSNIILGPSLTDEDYVEELADRYDRDNRGVQYDCRALSWRASLLKGNVLAIDVCDKEARREEARQREKRNRLDNLMCGPGLPELENSWM